MVPKKVLLAEDDADDRDIFFNFLRNRSDILLLPAAENGEEVIDFLENAAGEQLPDFILLDQNMPKKNGIQTLQTLKQLTPYKNIPVFIYSTYVDEMLQRQSTEAGAVSVFSKPHTMEGYHGMIDAILVTI